MAEWNGVNWIQVIHDRGQLRGSLNTVTDSLVPFKARNFFIMARQLLVSQGLLTGEASRSHSETPNSVGLLWTRHRPVAETFT
jgi:hypothetical protein